VLERVGGTPLIARLWRGETRAEDADAYLAYLQETGLPAYAATPGNRGVHVLRRLQGDRAEFLLVSSWDSLDAIRALPGRISRRPSTTRKTTPSCSVGNRPWPTSRWSGRQNTA
jgi:antibiotic biosynthesis monooxygenase (ABM) superfamily enzyme